MSQNIEMKELKDWLNDPTALKFKKILLNSRLKLLNSMSHGYIGQNNTFNKDLILSSLGGCEALEQVSNYIGLKNEEDLAILIKLFHGDSND
jgi:hypothetical protein